MKGKTLRRFAGSQSARYITMGSVLMLALLAGCEEPQPKTFAEFMEDQIARDGTLARCNQDREATLQDIECANARRAASTIALREEQARREALEQESQRKIEELRTRLERQEQAIRSVQVAAEAAAKAAYEEQWESENPDGPLGVDGEPLMPSAEAAAPSAPR